MLYSYDFYRNIEVKDSTTKQERADHLYGGITYDTALPTGWVDYVIGRLPKYSRADIVASFVWLYPSGNIMGQAAPLTWDACRILQEIEALE